MRLFQNKIKLGVTSIATCITLFVTTFARTETISESEARVVLGVNKNATINEAKASYRKLAKQYHPDINHSPEAKAKFQKISEAWETIQGGGFQDLRQRFSDISERYKLSFAIFNGGLGQDELLAIAEADQSVQKIVQSYFLPENTLAQNTAETNALSPLVALDLKTTLAKFEIVKNQFPLNKGFLYNVATTVIDEQSQHCCYKSADILLLELVKLARGKSDFKNILDSNVLNWWSASRVENDPILKYPNALREIYLRMPALIWDDSLSRSFMLQLFSRENIIRHWSYIGNLLRLKSTEDLWSHIAREVAETSRPNAGLNFSSQEMEILIESLTRANDSTRLSVFEHINEIKPDLLTSHSQLFRELLNVQDFSSLVERGFISLYHLMEGDNSELKQKNFDMMLNRFITIDPHLAADVIFWSRFRARANMDRFKDEKDRRRLRQEIKILDFYLNQARQKQTTMRLTPYSYSDKSQPFWKEESFSKTFGPIKLECFELFNYQ